MDYLMSAFNCSWMNLSKGAQPYHLDFRNQSKHKALHTTTTAANSPMLGSAALPAVIVHASWATLMFPLLAPCCRFNNMPSAPAGCLAMPHIAHMMVAGALAIIFCMVALLMVRE